MVTPEQAIQHAAKVEQFLKDDAISGAFARLERRYYEAFKQADSSEKRVTAWAKANVLDDFLTELRIIISTGERFVLEAAQAAKRPDTRG